MSIPPKKPKLYHITHIRNLPSIITDEFLWSDAERLRRAANVQSVGMNHIKERRLKEIAVTCHPGTYVGEYVPFYFCPRSVMLYILYRGNSPDLAYREGQGPIVHLQFDFHAVTRWAIKKGIRWAFTKQSAATLYVTDFFDDVNDLNQVNWAAVSAHNWQDSIIKDAKQAEYLIYKQLPWRAVEAIGVISSQKQKEVQVCLEESGHLPDVNVMPQWYY